MRRKNLVMTLIVMMALSTLSVQRRAHADSASYYPDNALNAIYTQEQLEEKKAQDLEEEQREKSDRLERHKREAELKIDALRFQIENLKMKESKAQDELESLNTNLAHVNDQIASYEEDHKKLDESTQATLEYLANLKNTLTTRQQELDKQIATYTEDKKRSEQFVYEKSMEIVKMKEDISKAQTKVAEAEANRAQYEAEEMKVRTDWTRLKMETAEHLKQRDDAVAQMEEAHLRSVQAQKDLVQARTELARAEKDHSDTAHKLQNDLVKYEREIQAANHSRIEAEAEKMRMESESVKIHEYATRMKDSRDEAVAGADEAKGLVLKSTVALASARGELKSAVDATDRRLYQREETAAKTRGLASAEEATHLLDGGQSWKMTKDCPAYNEPSTGAKAVGKLSSGTTVIGQKAGTNWMEIRNSSGESVYVQRKCGRFDESKKD